MELGLRGWQYQHPGKSDEYLRKRRDVLGDPYGREFAWHKRDNHDRIHRSRVYGTGCFIHGIVPPQAPHPSPSSSLINPPDPPPRGNGRLETGVRAACRTRLHTTRPQEPTRSPSPPQTPKGAARILLPRPYRWSQERRQPFPHRCSRRHPPLRSALKPQPVPRSITGLHSKTLKSPTPQKSHPDMTPSLRSSAVVLLPVLPCAEGINLPSSFPKEPQGTFPRSILCENTSGFTGIREISR